VETFDAWLDRLAAPGPDPGGGAAAGVMLALGSALAAKVAAYPPAAGADLGDVRAAADALRSRALDLVAADGAASTRLVAAWRTGSADLAPAALAAAGTSDDLLRLAAEAEPLLAVLAARGSAPLRADVAAAASAYAGGARVALVNLVGNLDLAGRPAGPRERARPEALIARLEEASRIPG